MNEQQAAAYCDERRRTWEIEERRNKIFFCGLMALLVLALVAALVTAIKDEQLPIEEQERKMRLHTERMDQMFR